LGAHFDIYVAECRLDTRKPKVDPPKSRVDLPNHGVDQRVIGHETVETTQVYIHADMRLKKEVLRRMFRSP
jgi:hypothetical protein